MTGAEKAARISGNAFARHNRRLVAAHKAYRAGNEREYWRLYGLSQEALGLFQRATRFLEYMIGEEAAEIMCNKMDAFPTLAQRATVMHGGTYCFVPGCAADHRTGMRRS